MNKINCTELGAVCISLTCTLFPLFGTSEVLKYGKNPVLLAAIIGFLIGLIPIMLIIYISKQLDDKDIFQYNKEKFKFIGKIINFLLIITVIYIGFILSWKIIDFVISNLLLKTSYYPVTIVLFSIIAFAVIKGKEVMSRSTFLLIILLLILLIFIYIFVAPNIEIDNLLPFFNTSKNNFIKTCLYFTTISSYPLVALLSLKQNDIVNKQNFKKTILIGYFITFILIFTFLFLIITNYGINFASLFSYPEYYLFKNINAFDFIQRVENVLSTTFFILSYGSICYLIFFVKTYFINLFNIKSKTKENIIIIILAIGVPIISIYTFSNYYIIFIINYYPIISSVILVMLILISFLTFITKKKKHS